MKIRTRIPSYQTLILIGLVALVSVTTFTIYKKWWPWLMRNTEMARHEAASDRDISLFDIVLENFQCVYRPHAMKLLSYERSYVPLDSIDLDDLSKLPGVSDAFWADFQRGKAAIQNGSIPIDTLLQILDYSKNGGMPGGRAQYLRRTVGGLTRFENYKVGGKRFPMLLRYQDTVYPKLGKRVVGIILDDKWFLHQLPSLMDSLARENSIILFMAPQPPDTQWLPVSDPFRAANNHWKETIGVMQGKDTLWWYGDRSVKIYMPEKYDGNSYGYSVPTEPFDLEVLVKTEFPETEKDLVSGKRIVIWLFPAMEIGIQAILVVFIFMVVAYRMQMKRNQIALAHLAHSVKTPVARLQLAADILEGGQVSSPDEERKVIQTVSGECRQLRRAVENAALSLEGGKIAIYKEPGDLAGLVRETTAAWQTSFDQGGVRLVVDGVDVPIKASFDRDKMRLALDNLIDNALRHTYLKVGARPEVGARHAVPLQVTVSLSAEEKIILLAVADSGAGIPKADIKNVFKRFSRSGKDPLTGVSGLGLGLALVKEIAEGHGGKVKIETASNNGAKISVEIANE